jgi:phenylalanyl-tRNA synthetase alpha chain
MSVPTGHLHPVTLMTQRVVAYFEPLGFEVVSGPEIETEQNNFDKLNVPADHPARDEHDTFYLTDGKLLRTHTSPVQIRAMQTKRPPVRLIVPGRCFRNEATDSTHNTIFHQIEGLVIEEGVSMAHLIGTLEGLMKHLVGDQIELRIRPGFFPFVEPGIELDFRRTKNDPWTELLGAGMVHPRVLGAMKVDAKKFNGFAFGLGVERLLAAVIGMNDARLCLSGDYRILGQFKCD